MHKWDFRNTYYLVIYRVREWEMWGVWDLKTPVGVRRDAISVHFWCIFLDKEKTYKIENQYLVGLFQRRERDYGQIFAVFSPFLYVLLTANNTHLQ